MHHRIPGTVVDHQFSFGRLTGVPYLRGRARVVDAPVLARILGRGGVGLGAARAKGRSHSGLDESGAVESRSGETRRFITAQSGKHVELSAAFDRVRERDERLLKSFPKRRARVATVASAHARAQDETRGRRGIGRGT